MNAMNLSAPKAESRVKRALGGLFRASGQTCDSTKNLTTSEFTAACEKKSVVAVHIKESPSGFGLFMRIKDDPNMRVLATTNQLQRNWSSLNSLVTFLHRHNAPVDHLTVHLNKAGSQHASLKNEAQ